MEVKSNDNLLIDSTPIWKRRRYFVVFMAFLGFFNIYTMRSNLSVAIVTMTSNRSVIHEDGSETFEQYFNWNSVERGYVLSAFYYGYVITQVIGGLLTRKIGGNILFGVGILFTALFTLLGPIAAEFNLYLFIATRALIGIFEGVTVPGIFQMWSKWAPPNERSRMIAASLAGSYAGIVVSMSLSGVIVSTIGWHWAFYVFGIFGAIWTILWLIFIKSSPADDKFIALNERKFIQQSIESVQSEAATKMKVPWLSIFTSAPIWALIVLNFAGGWGTFTIQTQLPQFLNDVLDYNIEESGLYTALPYLCLFVMLQIAGQITDYVIVKGFWTKLQTRKYFNCILMLFEMACMLIAVFFIDPILFVTLITLGVSMSAFLYANLTPNLLDIAPQFAGITVSLTNTSATIAGMLSPLITGFIVTDGLEEQWKIIFYITAGLYLLGSITYWIFAKADIQSWAKSPNDEEKTTKL